MFSWLEAILPPLKTRFISPPLTVPSPGCASTPLCEARVKTGHTEIRVKNNFGEEGRGKYRVEKGHLKGSSGSSQALLESLNGSYLISGIQGMLLELSFPEKSLGFTVVQQHFLGAYLCC